jgi:hypothetical protein
MALGEWGGLRRRAAVSLGQRADLVDQFRRLAHLKIDSDQRQIERRARSVDLRTIGG